jgi:arginine decarboxylase
MIVGNRVPRDYFITSGKGESDNSMQPGSFDRALKGAKIHNFNIIQYSSILPRSAVKIDMPKKYTPGAIMESIMAVKSGKKGETLTSGLMVTWVFDKESGESIGGLVAQYSGHDGIEAAKVELEKTMKEMFHCRYDPEKFVTGEVETIMESFTPQKAFGTVVVAIGFTSHEIPVMD